MKALQIMSYVFSLVMRSAASTIRIQNLWDTGKNKVANYFTKHLSSPSQHGVIWPMFLHQVANHLIYFPAQQPVTYTNLWVRVWCLFQYENRSMTSQHVSDQSNGRVFLHHR